MKYLVKWKLLPVPPEMAKTALTLLEASRKYTSNLIKQGKMSEMWNLADGSGGLALVEVESNDELFNMLQAEPYGPFLEYSVSPLSDIQLAYETAIKQFKQMLS
jgi:muconolactone delta-isomerase